MTIQYLIKAIYAAVVTFLGGLLAALLAVPDIDITDLSTAAWVTIILATVIALGGVLGLQAAPAVVSTSIK